ncbi:CPBP family intramembrane metalloprotease [Pseudomonas umsongensis]|uniref:CPBP family intramembrane glutamic endopeptidase n=1 Tax=Pseudomonas umsongensis TaxID=198618 RepID=UPI001247543C|nr:CPBP family intramembrane glutamic endopeptidase [Pseudomonas umsongensis]QFG28924.1 CPBP family intramembrane metalloprotease [Pseudomonas umsongensis]
MLVMPWPYLTLLSAGYVLALTYGQITAQASIAIILLLLTGFAAQQQHARYVRYLGHAIFILLALTLTLHSWPGFHNARMIDQERFTENAVPFSMYLNLDKPLIGFWLLLVCPWIIGRHSFMQAIKAGALTLPLTALVTLGGASLLGIVEWSPKWPPQAWLWINNNLLLVTLVEEALFRGYIQGGLSRRLQHLHYGEHLALLIASLLFGLAHWGAGWEWVMLATLAGACYGLAYRFGGLAAAMATHFGLNLLHFVLFTYPMLTN